MTVISKGLWLSHSPDLNPYDLHLRFMLNDLVYSSNPCTEGVMGGGTIEDVLCSPSQTNCWCAVAMFVRCPACL